ncbi:MAG: HAMP domain-containing sensor histidine kinase [Candidatus Binatia bacterium]
MTGPWRSLVGAQRRLGRRLTPERLRWTVRVRGTVIALFLALSVAAWTIGVLPALGPALTAAAAGTVMNLAAARRVARWERIPAMLAWTGLGDSLIITYVVVATGGTASPLLFLYVLQVLTTALVVDVTLGAMVGAGGMLLLAAAVVADMPVTTHDAVAPDRMLWLSSLGVTLLFLVFVGGHLTRRLARSERQLAGAHRRLTETHTALQDAYGRLARAEAELIETDRMKTLQLLVAGLAHELGNPLTVLAGTVEPLTEAVRAYERALALCAPLITLSAPLVGLYAPLIDPRADPAPQRALADALQALADAREARRETPLLLANCAEATSRATGLLAQLRDFGRGGRGTVRRPASVTPGLVGTLALLRYRLPAGVVVHESYADVPAVICVPAELNQVFINLLMNAIDALTPGGNLWLELARAGNEVRIAVRDDGAGIPPEVLPDIFEPFVTTKDAGRGTGLGLAISRAIVARHGGRIEVATAVGQGTTFTVALPIPDGAAEARTSEA